MHLCVSTYSPGFALMLYVVTALMHYPYCPACGVLTVIYQGRIQGGGALGGQAPPPQQRQYTGFHRHWPK